MFKFIACADLLVGPRIVPVEVDFTGLWIFLWKTARESRCVRSVRSRLGLGARRCTSSQSTGRRVSAASCRWLIAPRDNYRGPHVPFRIAANNQVARRARANDIEVKDDAVACGMDFRHRACCVIEDLRKRRHVLLLSKHVAIRDAPGLAHRPTRQCD